MDHSIDSYKSNKIEVKVKNVIYLENGRSEFSFAIFRVSGPKKLLMASTKLRCEYCKKKHFIYLFYPAFRFRKDGCFCC